MFYPSLYAASIRVRGSQIIFNVNDFKTGDKKLYLNCFKQVRGYNIFFIN